MRPDGDRRSLAPGVELADGLSEDEAVGLALWNDADFAAALVELEVSRAGIHQAGLLRDPALALLFPWGPKQLEANVTIPFDFLWARPKRLAVAVSDAERLAETLVVHGLDLVREVRADCIAWHLSGTRAALLALQVETAAQLAAIEHSRVRAGDAGPAQRLAADTRLARLRVEVQRHQQEADSAARRLALRCDTDLLARDLELVLRAGVPADGRQADELLQLALEARPELRASELGLELAAAQSGLARAEAWKVAAVIDANANGSRFEVGPGVALDLPVFDGGHGRAALADARLQGEAKRYLAVRRRIAYEVTSSRERLQGAARMLEQWRASVIGGLERELAVSERSHEAGESSKAVVLEACSKLLDARLTEIELEAGWRSAHADLERAVARRLDLSTLEPALLGEQ